MENNIKKLGKIDPYALIAFMIIIFSVVLFIMPYFFFEFSVGLYQVIVMLFSIVGIPCVVIIVPLFLYLSFKWRLLPLCLASIMFIVIAGGILSIRNSIINVWMNILVSLNTFAPLLIIQIFLSRFLNKKNISSKIKSVISLSPVLLLFSFIMGVTIISGSARMEFQNHVIMRNHKMPNSVKNIKLMRVTDEHITDGRLFSFDVSPQDLEFIKKVHVWDFLKDKDWDETTLEDSKYIQKYYGNHCPTINEPVFYEAIHEFFHSHCLVTNRDHNRAYYWTIMEKSYPRKTLKEDKKQDGSIPEK